MDEKTVKKATLKDLKEILNEIIFHLVVVL